MNLIDGDFYESISDFSFGDMYSDACVQPNYDLVKSIFDKYDNPTFFIETHRVPYLFSELKKFTQKCKVISHNSDYTFGQEILPHIPRNVEKFWCQNYNYIETDVVKSLPIGLERRRWFPEQRKQEVLKNMMISDISRDQLVYMNFNVSTNSIRTQIYEDLKDKKFINKEMIGNGGNYENYLTNLKKHKFIVSPPGNGIDCHRNWEAIYLGCIPIVLNSYFARNVFKDFSVFISTDLKNLDEKILIDFNDTYSKKSNYEKYLKLN